MSELIKINNQQLPVKEYNGKRVVTFKEIDTVHKRAPGTAGRSFRENRNRFIEGVDYFRRNSSEARNEYGIAAPNGLVLITESGYLMLAKSFNDDLAWQVQRELVNSYFRNKPEQYEAEQLTLETAEYHYYPKAWHGSPVITAADFAHFTGMSKEAIYPYFHKHPNFDIFHYRHLKNAELRDFKAENPSIPRCIADLYIITRKGCECMLKYFGLAADIPLLEKQEKEISPKLDKLNKGKTYNAAFIDELFRKEGVFMYGEEYIPLNTAVQYFCYASLFATPDAKATGQAHCVELRARDPKKPDTEYSFMGFNRAGIRHVVSLHNMMILGDKIHK